MKFVVFFLVAAAPTDKFLDLRDLHSPARSSHGAQRASPKPLPVFRFIKFLSSFSSGSASDDFLFAKPPPSIVLGMEFKEDQ